MEKPTVQTHPKYPDWVRITQIDKYFSTIDDINIKKSDIPAFIEELNALLNPKISR